MEDSAASNPNRFQIGLLRYGNAKGREKLAYGKRREYSATGAVHFYALRLHEAGMIKSTPQKILAQNTGWRFLNKLKKELKG